MKNLLNPFNIYQIILDLIILHLKFGFSQLFERVTVQENIPLNTVIFDLKPVLERYTNSHLSSSSTSQLSNRNITVFANQQETFWPFILDDFLIKLAKPLDREMVCLLQTESLRHSVNRVDVSISSYSDGSQVCLPGACCQLLHVNIITSPTELPTPFYIQVAVQDVNDNPPRFPPLQTPYIVIREDIKLDEKIWLPQAFDADSAQFSVAEYRAVNWIHGNQSHFQLGVSDSNGLNDDFNTGIHEISSSLHLGKPYFTVTEGLDRELIDFYSFTLIAIDGGGNFQASNTPNVNKALTGSVSIVIKISDVNDNHPTFEQNSYRAEVAENSMNSPIIEFSLIDRDVGDNGRVTLVIDDPSGQAQHLFRIILQPIQNPNLKVHSHTAFSNSPTQQSNIPPGTYYKGSLQIINPLDAERHPNVLRFHLVANDHGQPVLTSRCEIRIRIININDNPPKIVFLNNGKRLSDGRISLPEVETPQRAIVALVHVTDDDSPIEQIRCHLIKEEDMFTFEETGGTANFLTHQQTQQSYNLLNEAVGIHSTYKQYVIRTRKIPDREEKSFYAVTVECIDDEGPYALSRNASLHITITDVNEHKPMFTKSVFTGHVVENQLHAEVHMLTPIHATDSDLGVNALITYSLLSPDELPITSLVVTSVSSLRETSKTHATSLVNFVNSTAFFRIDPITGKLWTIQSLDCENRSEYHLIVIAKDSGLPVPLSSSASVIITVEDANDNVPEFINTHYLFEVPENAPGGTEIGVVEAIDKDVTIINQRVRYNLRGNSEDLKLVTIDRNSGILRTRRPIDKESKSSISLIVEAENEVPIQRSSSMKNDNLNMLNHIGTEASVVITILNINDNRPEFILIEPHRSHVTFTWEQLNPLIIPKSTQLNFTSMHSKSDNQLGKQDKSMIDENQKIHSLENANPVCEPLPHRVIDRDMESNSVLDCCILELLDNYDGLFALIPQAPSVLCAMYRPPSPQTYKLTLIAKDGLTNDSLSSQVHFTVIIRSDPNLRILDKKSNNPRSDQSSVDYLTGKQSNFDHSKQPNELTSNYVERDRLNKEYPHRSLNHDDNANSELLYSSGASSSASSSQQYKLNHSKSYGYGQQTLIIIVMASIAGVLCVLLLVAIILTKRCAFDTVSAPATNTKDYTKEETVNQNDPGFSMKCPSSTGSSPSRTKTFNTFPVKIHHIHPNPDYYAKEMVYHHPVGPTSSETTYDISLETMKPPNSITFLNNYTPFIPTNLRSNDTHLKAVSMHSPQTRRIQCQIPINDELYQEQKCATIKSPTCINPWSQSCSPLKNQTYMKVNITNPSNSPQKTSLQHTKLNENTTTQSIYQTIDTQFLKHLQLSVTPTNSTTINNTIDFSTPKIKRDHLNQLHNLDNNNTDNNKVQFNKTNIKLLPKDTFQQTNNNNLQFTKDNNTETNELIKPLIQKSLLQRTNSERSPYFQTSFV
ncbi:Protocadherin Fat 4 [Schistosoma japonicum]|nr:Protocadherin Fat 4 [Schistosoma japonicum]